MAYFLEKYWEPAKDRPGLQSVAAIVPHSVAGEIRDLVQACRATQTQALYPDQIEEKPLQAALAARG